MTKILDRLFQDVHIQLEFDINKNENKINELLMFSSDDFKLLSNKKLKTNFTRNKQKIKSKEFQLEEIYPINLTKFLQIISTFGEVSVRSSIK